MSDPTAPVMQDMAAKDRFVNKDQGDTLGGLTGLGSHEEQLRAEAEKNRPLTRWEKKKKRILGESSALKKNFFMGFLMGGAVGGLMGGLTGTYFAFQYRQFSLIPMMALTSGCSFGFFMGIGAIMRSGEMKDRNGEEDKDYQIKTIERNGEIKYQAMYRVEQ